MSAGFIRHQHRLHRLTGGSGVSSSVSSVAKKRFGLDRRLHSPKDYGFAKPLVFAFTHRSFGDRENRCPLPVEVFVPRLLPDGPNGE